MVGMSRVVGVLVGCSGLWMSLLSWAAILVDLGENLTSVLLVVDWDCLLPGCMMWTLD